MRVGYHRPKNEADFELLCLALLRRRWSLPRLDLYAHRGEKQFGVDIIDMEGSDPFKAAQCKLHDPLKSLPVSEVRQEVAKATEFQPGLDHYAILTTAKKSRRVDNAVIAINRAHRQQELFTVEIITWDGIESLLDQYTEIRDQFYSPVAHSAVVEIREQIIGLREEVRRGAGVLLPPSFVEADLNDAKQALDANDWQTARILLSRLKQRHFDELTERQKYRYFANLGATYWLEGNLAEAADNYIRCRVFQPNDEDARATEAQGYELLGNRAKAFELAQSILRDIPVSKRAFAMFIRTAPDDWTVQELESRMTALPAANAEIEVALAMRAFSNDDFERAERLAKNAVKENPEWGSAWLTLARSIHRSVYSRATPLLTARPRIENPGRLMEAIDAFSRAIGAARGSYRGLVSDALLGRGRAYDLLEESENAERDFEEARIQSPTDANVLFQVAWHRYSRDDFDRAIELSRRSIELGNSGDAYVLLALSLRERRGPQDRAEAASLLLDAVQNRSVEFLPVDELFGLAIGALLAESRFDDTATIIESMPKKISDAVLHKTFAARLAIATKETEVAVDYARAALALLSPETAFMTLRRLARVLSDLGLFREALPVWQRVVPPNHWSLDTRSLLDCAEQLGRHDIILDTCRGLREAGERHVDLLQIELTWLSQYDPAAAISLVENELRLDPNNKTMRLGLAALGVRAGRDDLVTTDLAALPSASEILPQNAVQMINILRRRNRAEDAVRFAYEVIHRNFYDPAAHRAMQSAMLGGAYPEPVIPPTEHVTPGTAVRYAEVGTEGDRWVVIEDELDLDESLNEISPESFLAKALIGLRVGQTFVLATGHVQDRIGKVSEVVSKYVYRFRDSIAQWQVRFPTEDGIEQINVPHKSDGSLDASVMLKSFDRRYEAIQGLVQQYSTAMVPIALFADVAGRDVPQTMEYLANDLNVRIRCCDGNQEENDAAVAALSAAEGVVLDLTALTTLWMAEQLDALRLWPTKLYVSSATVAELRQADAMAKHFGGNSMGKSDKGYFLIERSESERDALVHRFQPLLDAVTETCVILGGQSLAAVTPEIREAMIKAFGQGGAESIVLASVPGRVLWTDDLVVAAFGRGQFGTKRTWTQSALRWCTERGLLDEAKYVNMSMHLIGWHYFFTGINPAIFAQAGRTSGWDVDRRPLRQCIDLVGLREIDSAAALRLAVEMVYTAFKENSILDLAQPTTIRVLEVMSRRQGGLSLIRHMPKLLAVLFGIDVIHASRAASVIDAWIGTRERSLISSPLSIFGRRDE